MGLVLPAIGCFLISGYLAFRLWQLRPNPIAELRELLIDTFDAVKIETKTPDEEVHRAEILQIEPKGYGYKVQVPDGFVLEFKELAKGQVS